VSDGLLDHLRDGFYGGHDLYPFYLNSNRLKEYILVAGRSGSGKTNLTFVLMEGIIGSWRMLQEDCRCNCSVGWTFHSAGMCLTA